MHTHTQHNERKRFFLTTNTETLQQQDRITQKAKCTNLNINDLWLFPVEVRHFLAQTHKPKI